MHSLPYCCVALLSVVCGAEPSADIDRSRLILELRFQENLSDDSATKHTCTPRGEVVFADGRHGRCAVFDGRCWIDTGLLQQELGDEFTVECWVNPSAHQSQHADIFGNHASNGSGLVLQQDGNNTNQFLAAYGSGDGKWIMTPAIPLSTGRWQHVALVKSPGELRYYLNGVLAAVESSSLPIDHSPMPIAVGLGYSDPGRCFRGMIDEFRIWNTALDTFAHAGNDPALASETRSLFVGSEPRAVAGTSSQTWTLATADTQLTLGVTAASELVVCGLSCPSTGRNWITRPVAFHFLRQAETAGRAQPLTWRFVDAVSDDADGRTLTLRFHSADGALELLSRWQAHAGPGPIRHSLEVTNRSAQAVTIGEQPTFDLDLTGASTLWSFHSDGGTPDAVGVYRRALAADHTSSRYAIRTAPSGEFIPLVILDADGREGVYLGLEWSTCRIDAVYLASTEPPAVRLRAGNLADLRAELPSQMTLALRPGFIGTYCGDLDAAGNQLRRWLLQHCAPDILRQDPGYPKVQWNAFGATGKTPGSWDPIEKKFYPLIDDVAALGFEEVMIDVGWWQDNEPNADQEDWPAGMARAAAYAHERGLRFGLYWTDNLDMADAAGRQQRAARITRLFEEYNVDLWRSDSTRGEVIGPSFGATRGFYDMVDTLARTIPGFQWENCSGGGRIKDYGSMRRAVKIFNSDTYSPLHVRQAFFDSSHVLHPVQIEGHLGSTDGRYRPQGVAALRYAFRSMSMGAPEWFLDAPNGGNGTAPWSPLEKETVRAAVDTYKQKLRPLVRAADLYHILPRPDGQHWDGVQYFDPVTRRGVVYLFKPASDPAKEIIRFKGLAAERQYRLQFEDGTQPPSVHTGAELMISGLAVTLEGTEVSELVFFAEQK